MSGAKTFVARRASGICVKGNNGINGFIVCHGETLIVLQEQFDVSVVNIRVTIEPIKSKRERKLDVLRVWCGNPVHVLDKLQAIDAEDP